MRQVGAEAPSFELPAYVDGEVRPVDVGEAIGEGIVVLVFYPADFNPACDDTGTDLGDLDLFTMQKDVSVFAVSPDSVYSHRAFAERYGLQVPLLADTRGEVAAEYGVRLERDGQLLAERAVFVVDHHGEIRYAWATDDLAETPAIDPVKRAVGDIGGDETAMERYRVGHERYAAGREAFSDAMAAFGDREWMPARTDFETARDAFADAADHLNTAVRFAETPDFEAVAGRAERKASSLHRASEWLTEAADAFQTGRGGEGDAYRRDAQSPLEDAKGLPEPPSPDEFTLTPDGVDVGEDVVVPPGDGEAAAAPWRDDAGPDAALDLGEGDVEAAAEAATARDPAADAVDGDIDVTAVETDDGDEGEAGDEDEDDASIEGDAVEGDIAVDIDPDPDETGDDPAGPDGTAGDPTGPDGTADGPAEPAARDAATDAADEGEAATARDPEGESARGTTRTDAGRAGDGSERRPGDGTAAADATPDGEADADAEAAPAGEEQSAPVGEELDLTDPRAADDGEDDDERDDWNIPGR